MGTAVPAEGPYGTDMPRLTVLICTHDRAELLGRTLASLNAARRPQDWVVDIMVVANACSDKTPAVLADYRSRTTDMGWLPLVWFAEPTPGKSHALNAALPRLDADWVAFVDDDHRIDAGWLEALTDGIVAHADADLFCGRILPDWDGCEPDWVHDQGPWRIYPLPIPRQDFGAETRLLDADGPLPGGGNLVASRACLARTGPFSPALGPTGHDLGGAEDMDWLRRALRSGAHLRYVPKAVQYHYVDLARLTTPYLLRKAFERSASVVAIEGDGQARSVPLYLWRKLAGYAWRAAIALDASRRRFYLVRSAAALGEIAGHLRRRTNRATTIALL